MLTAADWSWKWCSQDGSTFEEIGTYEYGPSNWISENNGKVVEIRPIKSASIVVKVDGRIVKSATDENGNLTEPVTEPYYRSCTPDECEADGFIYQGQIFLPCELGQ